MANTKAAETPAADSSTPAEKITQRVAVTRALAAGKEKPAEAVPYIKEQFGLTMTNQNFSTLKSQIKKAAGTSTISGNSGRPASKAAIPSANGDPATLARQVKALVQQYGAAAVKGMVDVFAE